jgi:ATP-dependent helicase/nuclease subunit A
MYQLTPHQINALNTQNSISLTANAGSGKTYVLATRYLKIILEGNASIHEIAAITFTDKAAGELYKRVADELNILSGENNSLTVQKKIVKLRKQLVSAHISTIHSFCVDLLREFPVEASLDANFIPIDQRKTNDLIELSTEKIIKNKISFRHNSEDIKLLIRLLGSKRALARELGEMVHNRKNLFRVKDLYADKTPEETAIAISEMFYKGLEEILEIELGKIITNFNSINETVLLVDNKNKIANTVKKLLKKASKIKNNAEILQLLSCLREESFTKKGSLKSRGYLDRDLRGKSGPAVAIVERLFKEFEKLFLIDNTFSVEKELAKYSKAMLNISLDIIEEYENKKKQMGYLDFEDILLKTKEILGRKNIRKAVNKKYKYLLIDEYQDTNEIQYEIFLPIVDYLKTGNLFIVGDEKQSIYRFRDAELEVFGKTRDDIKYANDANLILTLPDSFRMAPGICLFTNQLFRGLFDNSQKMYGEVAHKDLVCARDDSIQGKIEFLISNDKDDLAEADLVARRIIRLKSECKEEVPDWNSIAVLVRKRSAFSELEKSFIEYNIPYTVIGGTGFYQQQSISDIYNYFAFLFNRSDDAALIGTLRSPFFSVSDIEIFQLSQYNGDSYWDKLIGAANTDDRWKLCYLIINENLHLTKRISIPSLLQKILNESDFLSTIASRNNGEQEINNINKLISITIKFFNQEFNSLYDYLTFLKSSISSFVEESQAAIEDKTNCVNIMTIHQAKGLQYSAVFLYRCHDINQSENVDARSFKVDKTYGLLTKVPHNDNYFGEYHSAPIVQLYNFIENRKSRAELKRLLYVGVTRAKNFLFISTKGIIDKTNKLNSFIDLLMNVLEIDFQKNNFSIEGELNCLVKYETTFKVVNRKIKIQIPLIKDIKIREISEEEKVRKNLYPGYLIDSVNDLSKGEIISATKFSVFKHCPLKYNLIYNLNLNAINNYYSQWLKSHILSEDYEFNPDEQRKIIYEESNSDTFIHSNIKGRIIHKILQSQNQKKDVKNLLNNIFENDNYFYKELLQTKQQLKKEIEETVIKFFESRENKFLNSFNKFKNEFEVYCKEENYYLFGIIDKVIFVKEKIILVDYKTDTILESEISKRAEKYLSQLNFYAFILKRLFPFFSEIELRIIFVKLPELPFVKIFTKRDENKTISEIKDLIISIRNNNYSVNLEHCSQCIFGINNNKCIVSKHDQNTFINND